VQGPLNQALAVWAVHLKAQEHVAYAAKTQIADMILVTSPVLTLARNLWLQQMLSEPLPPL
jgi:hypothetical protein